MVETPKKTEGLSVKFRSILDLDGVRFDCSSCCLLSRAGATAIVAAALRADP